MEKRSVPYLGVLALKACCTWAGHVARVPVVSPCYQLLPLFRVR
jgi:hypothetical protein